MPRKKPFSSKQKKKQLQDRRRRKQDGETHGNGSSSGERSDSEDEQGASKATVSRINQQPTGDQTKRKYDPNRYRLHFFQETKEEIAQRKEKAYQPYQRLPEVSLEIRIDMDDVLDFPKRPAWDYSLSKQKLEANEETYFRDYLDGLLSEGEKGDLSYFEVNLETWRQLWRVLEMSDLFLLMADIRHPLLHYSPALYKYITEDLHKPIILVLNKVDLAPPSLVVAWQLYFKEKFPHLKTACFTSFPKSEEEIQKVTGQFGKVVFKKRKRGSYRAMGPKEIYKLCHSIVQDKVDLSSWERKIEMDQMEGYEYDSEDDSEGEELPEGGAEGGATKSTLDCSYQKHQQYKDGILTIGCIGCPNVGKSSVLNGLMGKKVVSVSKTPGHTKHFQTIFLTPTVRLCDSPGLVFPSRMEKPLQVLGGLYPIAQLRDPYSVVGYLAQRADLPRLLGLPTPEHHTPGKPGQWTAIDICDAWAEKRGFLTARAARCDTYRAANNLLRLAVEGRICLCLAPPGYFANRVSFEQHPQTLEFIELQDKYRLGSKAGETTESESEGSGGEGTETRTGDANSEETGDAEENTPSGVRTGNPFALLADSD